MKNVFWENGKNIIKSLCTIIKKIRNIIIGTFRNIFNIEKDYAQRRYEICKQCEFIDSSILGEYCSKCGCLIKSKIKVKNEKCLMKKW